MTASRPSFQSSADLLDSVMRRTGLNQAAVAVALTDRLGRPFERSQVNKVKTGRRVWRFDEVQALQTIADRQPFPPSPDIPPMTVLTLPRDTTDCSMPAVCAAAIKLLDELVDLRRLSSAERQVLAAGIWPMRRPRPDEFCVGTRVAILKIADEPDAACPPQAA